MFRIFMETVAGGAAAYRDYDLTGRLGGQNCRTAADRAADLGAESEAAWFYGYAGSQVEQVRRDQAKRHSFLGW